ncbi:MAG: cytochrome b N-terminal domain-containing protein [Deltaproteobacteria bacterium]|nr:cytochrome b N-terminal domain-containing protein [Deltaproteobacteria bacterium]
MEKQAQTQGWIDKTLPVDWHKVKEEAVGEILPGHMKLWWYCLGGVPAIMFLILVVTGIMLAFHYVPHPDMAYESVVRITTEIPYGWWLRSIHRWSAEIMVVTVSLHAIRVFATGAYRHPRELCWITGALLLLLTFGVAFTGYSLVYTQMSYWAMTIGTGIAAKTPLIGPFLARFLLGGEAIGEATLNRFFILHAALLPTVIFLMIFVHIILIRLHGVAEHLVGIQREVVRGLSRGDE